MAKFNNGDRVILNKLHPVILGYCSNKDAHPTCPLSGILADPNRNNNYSIKFSIVTNDENIIEIGANSEDEMSEWLELVEEKEEVLPLLFN